VLPEPTDQLVYVFDVPQVCGQQAVGRKEEVGVGVNEAGQQGLASQVVGLGAGAGGGGGARLAADVDDLPVLHYDRLGVGGLRAGHGDDVAVGIDRGNGLGAGGLFCRGVSGLGVGVGVWGWGWDWGWGWGWGRTKVHRAAMRNNSATGDTYSSALLPMRVDMTHAYIFRKQLRHPH